MTPATMGHVANQPKTPQRTVRVPDEVWVPAKAKAERLGESVSDIVRRMLAAYAQTPDGERLGLAGAVLDEAASAALTDMLAQSWREGVDAGMDALRQGVLAVCDEADKYGGVLSTAVVRAAVRAILKEGDDA